MVEHADRFRAGDQIQTEESREVMFVTAADAGTNTLTVVRGYGGTTPEALADNLAILILGNAALEGADRPAARFTTRARKQNFTQIFTSSLEVSGSQLATRMLAVDDELDYQKQQRLREMIRDLENCVVNGVAPTSTQEGSDSVRRTMRGILPSITTNVFAPGVGSIPDGDGAGLDLLNEAVINAALRAIWQSSAGHVDTIVVNGFQKRRINSIIFPNRSYSSLDEKLKNLVSIYESDYGVCRVILSRWIPSDTLLLIDSSRIDVLPLAGRSFHYKPLSSRGDSEVGELIGEYTLEMRNENAHGVLQGLGTSE